MHEPDVTVEGVEVPAWDPELGRVVCVCGSDLRLVGYGAAPMIDSSGGPYETYGEWDCPGCGKRWIEGDRDGWHNRETDT